TIPKAIRVKNITLASDSEAQTIRNEIIRHRKIDELIQEYSISPDRDASGDMGYIEKGELPFELEQAIFKLTWQNKVSQIVHSQDGYHIFYWVKTRWRGKPTEKEASEKIKESIRAEKQDEFYSNWIKLLKDKATIQIDQAMLKSEEGF
ncbi:MAG: peptidylprolyl isomerase, partial [SAR324 cluster bacterium]|nr:peptidylprolyl isomerase [SAR324 cluster bacterium]